MAHLINMKERKTKADFHLLLAKGIQGIDEITGF